MIKEYFSPALILVYLCLFLTPFARAGEIPIVIMAIGGVVLFIRNRSAIIGQRKYLFLGLLFLLFWLPQLISVVDAHNLQKSAVTTLFSLRFLFAGIFMLFYLDGPSTEKVKTVASCILLFWVGDALVQFLIGYDLFGYQHVSGRTNGLFGRHLKLGMYLSLYLPILLFYLFEQKHRLVAAAGFVLSALVVVLAGSRGGWIMFVVGSSLGTGLLLHRYRIFTLKRIALGILSLAVLVAVCYSTIPAVSGRVNQSLLIFSGDTEKIDAALGQRLPIWRTGWEMFSSHPINGIGTQGFRYAYITYAAKDDPYAQNPSGIGAFHGHNMLVDIAAETGTIGLAGVLGFWLMLVVTWFRANREAHFGAAPFWVALLVGLFPLNTHFSFYSGAWMQAIFWLTALYVAALYNQAADAEGLAGGSNAF